MNSELIRNFTAEEVEFALKQMKPLTAPGPDGILPFFSNPVGNLVKMSLMLLWLF